MLLRPRILTPAWSSLSLPSTRTPESSSVQSQPLPYSLHFSLPRRQKGALKATAWSPRHALPKLNCPQRSTWAITALQSPQRCFRSGDLLCLGFVDWFIFFPRPNQDAALLQTLSINAIALKLRVLDDDFSKEKIVLHHFFFFFF